jgi:hypothetical protein
MANQGQQESGISRTSATVNGRASFQVCGTRFDVDER